MNRTEDQKGTRKEQNKNRNKEQNKNRREQKRKRKVLKEFCDIIFINFR